MKPSTDKSKAVTRALTRKGDKKAELALITNVITSMMDQRLRKDLAVRIGEKPTKLVDEYLNVSLDWWERWGYTDLTETWADNGRCFTESISLIAEILINENGHVTDPDTYELIYECHTDGIMYSLLGIAYSKDNSLKTNFEARNWMLLEHGFDPLPYPRQEAAR